MDKLRPVPFYKMSKMFVYITGNIFDENRFIFKLYLFQLILLVLKLISILILPFMSSIEEELGLKLSIDVIIGCYAFALMLHFTWVREEMADLLRFLGGEFSNYSSLKIRPKREQEFEKIRVKTRATEIIMTINCVKALSLNVIYPMLYDNADIFFRRLQLFSFFTTNDWAYICFNVVLNTLITMTACSFHNNWEIVMVSSISRLRAEMGVLADSITGIELRARNMFDSICQEIEASRYPRPEKHCSKNPRLRLVYSERMEENCLFECLKESIRHHQTIIEVAARLNKVVGMSSLFYAHTVGITVAICLFLIFQADQITNPMFVLYCLVILPTLMSQGLVCLFGQDLLDGSENVRSSLYNSNWQTKSKRYISCFRIMMLCSHRPLRLKSVFYTINKNSFVEFIKCGYSLLNFLLTMKKAKITTG